MANDASNTIGYFYRRWLMGKKLKLKCPPDVEQLFKEYAGPNELMTADKFVEFLVKDQEEERDAAEVIAKETVKKSYRIGNALHKKGLDKNHFLRYLIRRGNRPLKNVSENDWDAQLSHHYWYTGHAFYIYSKCLEVIEDGKAIENFPLEFPGTIITKSIRKALKDGIRVIELDLWPTDHENDIEVRPKGISKCSIGLKECLTAIEEAAFSQSQFPIILILVDNFDSKVRDQLIEKLMDSIKKTFGNKLSPAITKSQGLKCLKGKIITSYRLPNQSKTPKDIAEKYKDIISIPMEVMDENFEDLRGTDTDMVKLFSLTPDHLENSSTYHKEKVTRFAQDNMLAVYPNPQGTQTFSTICDPIINWIHGAHLVTSYVDTEDHPENKDHKKFLVRCLRKYQELGWIEQGMLRAYGNHGCVKKPEILLEGVPFNPRKWRTVKNLLQVKVYFGTGWNRDFNRKEFDPNSPPDFFTSISILGVPQDEATERTSPAVDDWNPYWDQEFEFPLTVPELAILAIKVGEFDADRAHQFGGQTCLPVSKLRDGIRAVTLYDKKGKIYRGPRLLMRFKLV